VTAVPSPAACPAIRCAGVSLAKRGIAAASVRVSVNPELTARLCPSVEKAGLPATALDGLAHLNAEIEAGR